LVNTRLPKRGDLNRAAIRLTVLPGGVLLFAGSAFGLEKCKARKCTLSGWGGSDNLENLKP
jgi:hypothetical protein